MTEPPVTNVVALNPDLAALKAELEARLLIGPLAARPENVRIIEAAEKATGILAASTDSFPAMVTKWLAALKAKPA